MRPSVDAFGAGVATGGAVGGIGRLMGTPKGVAQPQD